MAVRNYLLEGCIPDKSLVFMRKCSHAYEVRPT